MPAPKPIGVLLVAQSREHRALLLGLLEADAQVEVLATSQCVTKGVTPCGGEALDLLARHSPQVVLLDVSGRGTGELECIGRIMQTRPLPIVVCGDARDFRQSRVAVQALQAGAIACVDRPDSHRPDSHAGRQAGARAAQLLQTVKLMSEVKVVRRQASRRSQAHPERFAAAAHRGQPSLVAIGASTGGPPVLRAILAGLPADFPVPILAVQHIAPGFLPGLVQWLSEGTSLQVRIAGQDEFPLPGHVYLAPDDHHMGLGPRKQIVLTKDPPEEHVRPAVSFLFRSVARMHGASAVGILLTGMGRDGAEELKYLKEKGALTIAQDEASSVVHGMPGTAIACGAASQVLAPERIAPALMGLLNRPTV